MAKIHEIQGVGDSVVITVRVTVEAVVTSLYYSSPDASGPQGFFLQEEDADADGRKAASGELTAKELRKKIRDFSIF